MPDPRWPNSSSGSRWGQSRTLQTWVSTRLQPPTCSLHPSTTLEVVGKQWSVEWGRYALVTYCAAGGETWLSLPSGILAGSEDVAGEIAGPWTSS